MCAVGQPRKGVAGTTRFPPGALAVIAIFGAVVVVVAVAWVLAVNVALQRGVDPLIGIGIGLGFLGAMWLLFVGITRAMRPRRESQETESWDALPPPS